MVVLSPVLDRSVRRPMLPPKLAAFSAAVVCYIGLVANRVQAELLATGRPLNLTSSTVGIWQYAREAITVLLTFALVVSALRQQQWRLSWPTLFISGYLAAATVVTIMSGTLPTHSVLFGLRFGYVVLLLVAVRRYADVERRQLIETLARLLVPFLLIEAAYTLDQVLTGRPTLGATHFGSRPWGTYSSADNLGLAMLALLALYVIAQVHLHWAWATIAALMCVLTGSRTAVIGAILVLGGVALARWRTRIVALPFAVLMLYGVYSIASSRAISGREITGEARVDTWSTALSRLHGLHVIFGEGVGVGTNSLVATFGTSRLSTGVITDSTFIAIALSLGAIGVALAIAGSVWLVRTVSFERRLTLVPMTALAALSFNVLELSPFNVVMAILLGCSLRGAAHDARTSESGALS